MSSLVLYNQEPMAAVNVTTSGLAICHTDTIFHMILSGSMQQH